ncbi:ESF1 homolog isoform X2 [Gouania willdenowi]|nr:ESF1 homolog isoform X2 [Gouania willdenowi]
MATGPNSDKRFSVVGSDPRFWEIPDAEHRVNIDPRFTAMFSEERFNSSSTVDKRGRQVSHSHANELRRLYRVEAESDNESDDDDDDDDEESDSADPARGKGNVETSSEDDDEEDDVDEILRKEEDQIEHCWGEMSRDAPRSEKVSTRLAVCNIDWDRLKAKDLLLLLRSFVPKGGAVLSVKIFLSEFGKQRLKEEEIRGPMEIRSLPEDSEDDTEEESVHRERVRDYQFKRLQYFYAVVECDSEQTSAHVYQECDGYEYESSCSTLDLRFIPDDVTFEEADLKDEATEVNTATFEPKLFTSSAAGSSKVQLSWDETDHERVTALNKKFNKEELLQMDFSAYLASSSEEEEQELPAQEEEQEVRRSSEQQISRYRNLLKIKEQDEEEQQHMEISWKPGLKQSTRELVKKKLEVKELMTPWQKFLQKKKEKKKKSVKGEEEEDDDDDLPPDVDLSDPFFSELREAGLKKKPKKKKKKQEEKQELTAEEEAELQREKAQISLLLDDDEDVKHKHFNYEQIVEQQNLSKKKQQKKKKETPEEDHFLLDVADPRFDALYSSPLFNIDPSHPSYKSTSANHCIAAEKRRRRQSPPTSQEASPTSQEAPLPQEAKSRKLDPQLQLLVKSVKNKTLQFEAQRKKKV